jgi:elongation factor 3
MVKVSGVVNALTGLRKKEKDGTYSYQITWVGKSKESDIYMPMAELEKANKNCFGKLIKAVDEKIAAMDGLYIKPLTQGNVESHLAQIGLEPEAASHTKLSQLSDGEKVKAVLGACMWMSPHVIVFDEPTNSLSWDSLVALVSAIKEFKGGVVVISHNQAFIDKVCNEIWLMKKDPTSGIAHLGITGGETTDMKHLLDEQSKEDTYIDGAGNVCKLKQQLADKELKKKIKDIEKKLKDNKKAIETKKNPLSDDDRWALEDELAELTTVLEKQKAATAGK